MEQTIMNGLLELVKTGGPLALWGISIWLILGIVRISVVVLAAYLAVKVICQTIQVNYKIKHEINTQRVHLLSEQVSRQLTDSLNSFTKESLVVVNELKAQLTELKELLKKK